MVTFLKHYLKASRLICYVMITAFCLFSVSISMAQRSCGSDELHEHLTKTDPDYIKNRTRIDKKVREILSKDEPGKTREQSGDIITIPIVFHIFHNGDAVGSNENISDALIQAQVDQLNDDFRRTNSDAGNTPSDFTGVASDTQIQFCLAKNKPDGTTTTGINRYNISTYSGDQSVCWNGDYLTPTFVSPTIWDRDRYLNFYSFFKVNGAISTNPCAGILGYAPLPGTSANRDAVVCKATSIGSIANPNPNGGKFAQGRTGTHEVGHWLNLYHIWRSSCSTDDEVADTPNQGEPNYTGSPCTYPGPNTCGAGTTGDSPDMFQNYMDYSGDACMNLFTTGQKDRMRAAITASRPGLLLATCGPTPVNDLCSNATTVTCGGSYPSQTTVGASAIGGPAHCEGVNDGTLGVWYSFVGNDRTVTVETCGNGFDTVIDIYTGDCDGTFTCAGGNDDGEDVCHLRSSKASFFAESGVTYYFYIHSYYVNSTGTFDLTVDCCNFLYAVPPAGQKWWTGCVNDDWDNALNWIPREVPQDEEFVVVPTLLGSNGSGEFPAIDGSTNTILRSQVYGDATLTVESSGTLNINGLDAHTGIYTFANGTFINDGQCIISNTNAGIYNGGIATNNGTLTIDGPLLGIYNYVDPSTFTNNGEIYINNGDQGINNDNPGSSFVNSECAAVFLDASCAITHYDGTFTNMGLIDYQRSFVVLNGTYDNTGGFIHDQSGAFANVDASGGTYLTYPLSYNEFTGDLNDDGTAFCEGDALDFCDGTTVVTNSNDDGPGSLRYTIACAAPNDVITFDPSTDGNPIMLTGPQIVIDKPLTFEGNGEDATIIDGIANDSVRLMFVNSGAPCNFRDMRFQNGGGDNFHDNNQFAGAIYFYADTKFVNCTFNNNKAANGGAIASAFCGTTIIGCQFYENEAVDQSGAIDLFSQPTHNSTITNTLIHHNTSGKFGTVYNHGTTTGGLYLYNNTIADNTSTNGSAGGIVNSALIVNVMNNIIANNTSPSGSQIFNGPNGSILNAQKNIISDLTGSGLNASTDANPVDPNFVDAAGYDYHLASPSPGINAGNNGNLQADDCDVDGDTDVAEPYPIDLDGAVRVLHGKVDLGALETDEACEFTSAGITIGSCNDNGTTDPSDDTYTITLDPTGLGLGFKYSISGGALGGSTATYGLPVTFTRPISLGVISYTLADVNGGCTLIGSITPPEPCSPLPGETCAIPIPIACGDLLSGDNSALDVTIAPNCRNSNLSDFYAQRIWYSFTGDGSLIEFSMSSNFSDIAMIYSSTCDTLICEDEFISSTLFQTQNGIDYLIAYSGFSTNSFGTFTLEMDCCPPPENVVVSSINETSFDVTWDSNGQVVSSDVEVCPEGTSPGDPSCISFPSVSSPFTVTGLASCAPVEVYVKDNCAGEESINVSKSEAVVPIPAPNLNPACGETIIYPTCGPPNTYNANDLISYTICPTIPTDIVSVTFSYFDVEVDPDFDACFDFIEVMDVATSTSFGQFCSEKDGDGDMPAAANDLSLNPTFTASGPGTCLTVIFDSDDSVHETGFSFDVTCDAGTDPCEEDISLVSPDDDINGSIVTKVTNQNIIASNKILGASDAVYSAGVSVSLDEGFEVERGAIFQAYIEGCIIASSRQGTHSQSRALTPTDKIMPEKTSNK